MSLQADPSCQNLILTRRDLAIIFQGKIMAEREGFEPSIPFWSMHAFQACAFNHSATSPPETKLWPCIPLDAIFFNHPGKSVQSALNFCRINPAFRTSGCRMNAAFPSLMERRIYPATLGEVSVV